MTASTEARSSFSRTLSQPMREVGVVASPSEPMSPSSLSPSPSLSPSAGAASLTRGPRIRIGTLNCNKLGVQPKDAPRIVAIARAVAAADLDLLHLSELENEEAAQALCVRVNASSPGGLITPAYGVHFHMSAARDPRNPSLALLYRLIALEGGSGEAMRIDDRHSVNLRNPATREVFDLRLRRGYLFRCSLNPQRFGRRPPLTLAGLHLQSSVGASAFSHYKRIAQARIVRAALQPCVLAEPEEDVLILGEPYRKGSTPSLPRILNVSPFSARECQVVS